MLDQQTYELIERFLDGDLDPAELAAFESRLQAEPGLLEEVRLHQELQETLSDEATLDFSAMVSEVVSGEAATVTDTVPAPKRGIRGLFAIAASIAILVVAGFFLLRNKGADPQALFQTHFEAYDVPMEFRGMDSSLMARYDTAFAVYNASGYDVAISEFESLLQENPEDPTLRFYLSVSQLATGNGPAAEAGFRMLLAQDAPTWRSQSQWYLALSLLKQDKTEAAKAELESLAGRSGKYAKLAQELLEEL